MNNPVMSATETPQIFLPVHLRSIYDFAISKSNSPIILNVSLSASLNLYREETLLINLTRLDSQILQL